MMSGKFAHTYRIPSARLANWDYRSAAAYFVTICTQNREHHFGKVVNGRMNLSGMGVIADILWHEMVHHAKMVDLDAFVVMPNHIHGIVIIRGFAPSPPEQMLQDIDPVQTLHDMATVETLHDMAPVQTLHATSLLGFPFAWQTRFHDHIIRNDGEFDRIRQYIIDNPQQWENDKFYDQ